MSILDMKLDILLSGLFLNYFFIYDFSSDQDFWNVFCSNFHPIMVS